MSDGSNVKEFAEANFLAPFPKRPKKASNGFLGNLSNYNWTQIITLFHTDHQIVFSAFILSHQWLWLHLIH